MDKTEHKDFVGMVAEILSFYGKEISKFSAQVWWETCRRFDFEAVRRAFSIHVQDPDRGQFCPKPADIIRLLEGGSGDRSMQAWSRVERAIRELGGLSSVVFDDPTIHAVIQDMGGWERLCDTPEERELQFRGNEFRKRYQGYALRPPQQYPPVLHGRIARQRARDSFPLPKPDLVGDPDQCQKVIESGSDRRDEITHAIEHLPQLQKEDGAA